MAIGIPRHIKKRTQEIYQYKCLCPSLEDILNFLYDIEDDKQHSYATALYQAWAADDAILGLTVRNQIKRCFFEVAAIEALDERQDNL